MTKIEVRLLILVAIISVALIVIINDALGSRETAAALRTSEYYARKEIARNEAVSDSLAGINDLLAIANGALSERIDSLRLEKTKILRHIRGLENSIALINEPAYYDGTDSSLAVELLHYWRIRRLAASDSL